MASISSTAPTGVPQETLVSMARIQAEVRKYRHEVRTNSSLPLGPGMARIGDELRTIREQLLAVAPSDTIQRDFRILSKDYAGLVNSVKCIAYLLHHASSKNPPTLQIPSKDSESPDVSNEEFATPRSGASTPPRLSVGEDRRPSGIVEILNMPRMDEASFDQLMASLTQEAANTRFFVQEPTTRDGRKRYLPATASQIAAKGCPKNVRPSPDHNHTTTLSNILARNELGFSREQVNALVRKLIAVQADFSAIDYTFFTGMAHYYTDLGDISMQNTPLKSFICLGSSNTHYDETLVHLIRHIGSLREKHTIFDHEDHFPDKMSPLCLLIRQGKEDIALHLLDCGAHVQESDLVIACQSFGTTFAERPRGVHCMEAILGALVRQNGRISPKAMQDGSAALLHATQEAVSKQRERLTKENWLRDCSRQDERNETPMSRRVRAKMEMDFATFKLLCASALSSDLRIRDQLLHIASEELVFQAALAEGIFNDDYRAAGRDEARLKYAYANSPAGKEKVQQLIELLEKSAKEESKAPMAPVAPAKHASTSSSSVPVRAGTALRPFVVKVPVGIPRRGTMNCWAIVLAQFARRIPSLDALVQTDPRLKAFAAAKPDSQTLRTSLRSINKNLSASSGTQQDAHEGLMAFMDRFRPFNLVLNITTSKRTGESAETRAEYCSVIPISILNHNKRPLPGLFEEYMNREVAFGNYNTGEASINTERRSFETLPRELFFQIVRFQPERLGRYKKIGDDITIDTRFNLHPGFIAGGASAPAPYECDAFIVQRGSMSSGHYVAYIKFGTQWYLCDDDSITPISLDRVKRDIRQAYIVHYAAV